MNPANPNLAASVRARLLNVAKAQDVDFNQVLVRSLQQKRMLSFCCGQLLDGQQQDCLLPGNGQ